MGTSGAETGAINEPEKVELAVVVPLFLAGLMGHELGSALLTLANTCILAAVHFVLRTLIKGSLMLLAFYGVLSTCVVDPLQDNAREWVASLPVGVRKGVLDAGEASGSRGFVPRRVSAEMEFTSGGCLCAICLEQIQGPVMLPCDHTFCGPCIGRWSSSSRHVVGSPTCPCCRKSYHLPVSGVFDRLVENMRSY